MAQNQSPALFAVALLLLAAAAPLALAQVPLTPIQLLTPGSPILPNLVQVTGALCCSPTGICIGGPGIGGVNFTMSCTTGTLGSGAGSLIVGQGTTSANGGFTLNISVPALLEAVPTTLTGILNGKLPCEIVIRLPIDQALCPTLSVVTGVLAGALSMVGTTITTVGVVVRFLAIFSVRLS